MTERLLLCRPMGGLNDMLCQVEQACRYADQFDRTVIVDTRYRARFYFRDSFSNYFASLRDRLVLDADAVIDHLDQLDVFPSFLAGRVTAYDVRYDRDIHSIVEADCGQPTSFDFGRDYAEPLIIHHAIGGGTHSIGALGRMCITEPLLEVLRQRLAAIGGAYGGIHVRNTDYRARYRRALVPGVIDTWMPLFLATDNRGTVAEFKAVFAERLHSFANLPELAGAAAHHIDDLSQAYERNRDSVLDLVMLGLASHLYMFELEPNLHGVQYSGFSMLAASLHNDRAVLKSLISGDAAMLEAAGLDATSTSSPA